MIRDDTISKLNSEISYFRNEVTNIHELMETKEAYANKLNMEISSLKNQMI